MNLTRVVAPRLLVALTIAGAPAPAVLAAQRAPNVSVWFDQGNEFDRGQPGRVMYTGDAGSYVAVVRVDADGRMSVLSPQQPNDRSRFSGARSGIGVPFQADPAEGVGYVFAVASRTPFDFRSYRGRGNRWDTGTLGQRGGVDPFEIVDRFARSSAGARGNYTIAYAPYEVGRGGAGRMAYQQGVRYEDGYGYGGGYEDPWGASPYRQGYDNYRYYGGYHSRGYDYAAPYSPYNRDPRTHYLRHCPDGTLAPYTTRCRAFAQPHPQQFRGQSQQQMQPSYPRSSQQGKSVPSRRP